MAKGLGITAFALYKIWQRFFDCYTVSAYEGNLRNEDIELIEVSKHEKPPMFLAEISNILEEMCNSRSINAISRALKNRMPSGCRYSRKKLITIARERFTKDDILYAQPLIDF